MKKITIWGFGGMRQKYIMAALRKGALRCGKQAEAVLKILIKITEVIYNEKTGNIDFISTGRRGTWSGRGWENVDGQAEEGAENVVQAP